MIEFHVPSWSRCGYFFVRLGRVDAIAMGAGRQAIASAFFAGGNVVGAISVAGPPSRFTEGHIAAVAEPVKLAAEKISTRLTPLRDLVAPETGVLVRSN